MRYGHGMDSCVTVWILPLCFVVTPILNIPVVYIARLISKRFSFLQCIYSKSGNNQWQLWIYFISMVFVRPCPLVHMNCPHCKVHLLVSKTITLKFTENICCVDIVWRGENQNKTNEEHPRCKQFRNNADTLCYKPFWMSVDGSLIDKVLLKVMIDPTFYVQGC